MRYSPLIKSAEGDPFPLDLNQYQQLSKYGPCCESKDYKMNENESVVSQIQFATENTEKKILLEEKKLIKERINEGYGRKYSISSLILGRGLAEDSDK